LIATGWNRLVVFKEGEEYPVIKEIPLQGWKPLYGNGHAARKIAAIIRKKYFNTSR
jgi:hypothetical protein